MNNQGLENNHQVSHTKNIEVKPIVVKLLLQILENTVSQSSDTLLVPINGPINNDEIILSIAIDGFRYTLIRSIASNDSKVVRFSPREIEIIRLVCKGMANKEIASLLEISRWTVGTYLRRLFIKMDVNSRTELVSKILHHTFQDR